MQSFSDLTSDNCNILIFIFSKHRDAALSKGPMESQPLTVIKNPRDFNEAKQNKIPESFWPTQDKVLPRVEQEVKREPAHLRVDPLPTPMEEDLSPRYAPSTVAGPSRVTDLQSDPNIEKFDQMVGDGIYCSVLSK